jgi:hypothetical protein
MRQVRAATILLVLAWLRPWAAAAGPTPYPVSEIRPGLRGVLLTVLEGERPDTLAVEVAGVLDRSNPDSHLILIRGLDPRLARTGIAAGMSGSPIYVGDRLLGAMAFAFVGATEPIGGATPYEEMVASLDPTFRGASPSGGSGARPGAAGPRPGEIAPFPEWRKAWAARAGASWAPATPVDEGGLPDGLRPIALPVFFGGPLAATARASATWQSVGLAPASGEDGATGEASRGGSLAPGDAFGIQLIAGDMLATAIGTVTSIDGDRLLGLGHPAFGLSPIEVPITRARIHTIVPTNAVSFKVGSALEEVGALVTDRQTGVAALLGRRAPRIPFDLTLRSAGDERRYHFDIVRSDILTPGMMSAAVEAALSRRFFALGQATLATDIRVTLADGRSLERRDLFQTIGPAQTAAADAMAPVAYLAASGLAPFSVVAVTLDLDFTPEIRAAKVDRVTVPRGEFHRGEEVPVTVRLLRSLDGPETRTVTLRVPDTLLPGPILLAVGSAEAFYAWDQERAPQKYTPRTLDDLLRLMREYPSEEGLIARLYGPSRGVVHQGRELASLPLSKWNALSEPSGVSQTAAVSGRILSESVQATGEVVQGGVIVPLEIVR